ncbi:NYN domain-containing protein [bacterium]|nr:NYN domain-containing protein [bacterium]
MRKIIYIIDGFNLYHSVRDLKTYTGSSAKWLDISSLCKSYIYLFGKDVLLEKIFYFSAIPYYLKDKSPDKIKRQKDYQLCLESTGIQIELARFKSKNVYCDRCNSTILKHEEKETDVAMAVKIFELFFNNACDDIIIVSGDTDLAPAVRTCKMLFPSKNIIFAFPYHRKNKELATLAPGSFSINKKQYLRYQLPNPVLLKNGEKIYKPSKW